MKRFILSIVTFLLAGVMSLALLCPLAEFKKVTNENNSVVSEEGQSATMLYFIESIFLNEEKINQASLNLTAKTAELALEVANGSLTVEESANKLKNSSEKNRYDVYNFATKENLTLTYGIAESNMIKQTKVVSGLSFAFLIAVGLILILNLITMFVNSKKLRALGTFFSLLAFVFSVALTICIELVLKVSGTAISINSTVKWFAYLIIAYSFAYFVVRLIINGKLKKS